MNKAWNPVRFPVNWYCVDIFFINVIYRTMQEQFQLVHNEFPISANALAQTVIFYNLP